MKSIINNNINNINGLDKFMAVFTRNTTYQSNYSSPGRVINYLNNLYIVKHSKSSTNIMLIKGSL